MKWFTRDREYEYVEGEPDPTHEAYRAHIAELRPLLPEGLKRLAEGGGNLSLHDGSFIRASKDPENVETVVVDIRCWDCLLYTSPSPRDRQKSRMPSSA